METFSQAALETSPPLATPPTATPETAIPTTAVPALPVPALVQQLERVKQLRRAIHLLPQKERESLDAVLTEAQYKIQREEIWRTPENFIFSGHCYTRDPHHTPHKRAFPPLPYLLELVWRMHTIPMLAIEKSRQMMATNTAMAYAYWFAASTPGRHVFVRSERKDQAVDILSRCRYIHENLPKWLQPRLLRPLDQQNRAKLEFAEDSFIHAMAEGAKKIRSTTPSLVIDDEAALWEEGYAESYAAVLPALEGGGRLIAMSSAMPGDFSTLVNDQF